MAIERVGVVGCGLMGSGIGEEAARAGLDVRVVDLDRATLDRIAFSVDIDSLADRQLVVEAVIGAEPEKVAVFQALDKVVEDTEPGLLGRKSGRGFYNHQA
jgi:3-hydroxybutyryl-CoA dehydrogenase